MRLLLICLLATSQPALSATFRCNERLTAETVYQNHPCPGGTFQRELRLVTPPPPQLFAVPQPQEILARPPVRVVPLIASEPARELSRP